jgi:ribonuclease HI
MNADDDATHKRAELDAAEDALHAAWAAADAAWAISDTEYSAAMDAARAAWAAWHAKKTKLVQILTAGDWVDDSAGKGGE